VGLDEIFNPADQKQWMYMVLLE